jgi:hypothetical protein
MRTHQHINNNRVTPKLINNRRGMDMANSKWGSSPRLHSHPNSNIPSRDTINSENNNHKVTVIG